MRRPALLCLPAVLLLGACSSAESGADPNASAVAAAPTSTSEAAPTTTAAPMTPDAPAADQALTRTLYDDLSQSTTGGLDALAAAQAGGNHPEYTYTVEECRTYLQSSGLTDAFRLTAVPDVDAMVPDPDWAVPDGRYQGLVPTGTIYVLPVTFEQSDPDLGPPQSSSSQVHVAVLDGQAYFFQPCE